MAKRQLTIEDFLTRNRLPALTVFAGSHLYDHSVSLQHAQKIFSDLYGSDFEMKKFSSSDLRLSDALSELCGGGFFHTATLAVMRDYPATRDAAETLANWLYSAPADTSVLYFVPDAPLTSSLFKDSVQLNADFFVYPEPKGKQFRARAAQLIKSRMLSIDESAAEILFGGFEGDLLALSNELDKITMYLGSRRTVKREDLEQISCARVHANKFELVDKIVHGKTGEALDLLERLLREGEQAHALLAVVSTEIRKILSAIEMLKAGVRLAEIPDRLQIKYFADRFMSRVEAARAKWDSVRVLSALIDADRQLKTSAKPPELVMEAVVFTLTAN